MNFEKRSYQKELLDRNDIPFADIERNMVELNRINHLLGGHRISCLGLKKIIAQRADSGKPLSILEIGCGGGDNLRALRSMLDKKNIQSAYTGVDINTACIAFAEKHPMNRGIRFICSDYRSCSFQDKPDIIFSALFCHHFTDDELVDMLQWMEQQSGTGFFINDLHRHPLAYYSIKWLTAFFSRSYLVKHDAPLSVRRGFRKKEWRQLLQQAGLARASCSWHWAFRWLVTCTR